MNDRFSRTALMLGDDALNALKEKRIAVFGLGGVGGYAVEALARSGVGALDLIDHDTISLSNCNRQILALDSTIGKYKVEVAKQRVLEINPQIDVNIYKTFFLPESANLFPFDKYDYIIDAIDTVTAKLALAEIATRNNIPIISCMGTGDKLDPTALKIADITETSVCPLARIMRKELKTRNIKHLKVLYSTEKPAEHKGQLFEKLPEGRRSIPSSNAFVPSVAGLIIAGEVIKNLIK